MRTLQSEGTPIPVKRKIMSGVDTGRCKGLNIENQMATSTIKYNAQEALEVIKTPQHFLN